MEIQQNKETIESMEPIFIEMKQSDIRILKEKIWLMNDKKCPVLGIERPLDKMALDHIHANKSDEYSINKGTIRTSLDFRVNAVLGKLENAVKRTGLDKEQSFNMGDFLRKAADYFDNEPYHEDNKYFIHPLEVKKDPLVSKKNYNKLKKVYTGKAKFPEFPSSGKLTKPLEKLFKEYNIEPYN